MSGFFKTFKTAFGLGIEMPPYEVVKKLTDNIEIRKYPSTKWVCTKVEGLVEQEKSFSSNMFYKLFNYISGTNDKSQKIAMTAPVTIDYKNESGDKLNKESKCQMTMRFYVPKDLQNNTPIPTNDAFLQEEPEMIAAVARFGGYATVDDYMKYRDLIVEQLGDEAKNYDAVNMISAAYDSPIKPIYRTNEVWLRKIN